METMIVTGGAGFIGSNFVTIASDNYEIVVLDSCTYASNTDSLKGSKHIFELADIRNYEHVKRIFNKYKPNYIVHFAAESHVDNSISAPLTFVETNVLGTACILEAMRGIVPDSRMLHVSTDEVYGSVDDGGFTESSNIKPSSPYSATKAASDLLALSYSKTFGLDIVVTHSSNNYGPYQHLEKLIPMTIFNAIEGNDIPIYGDGSNIRDWMYVEDNVEAILQVLESGKSGERYNIGGNNELKNIDLVYLICDTIDQIKGIFGSPRRKLVKFVNDRPAHDKRYSVDSSKVMRLGWKPRMHIKDGIYATIEWYLPFLENLKLRSMAKTIVKSNYPIYEPLLINSLKRILEGK